MKVRGQEIEARAPAARHPRVRAVSATPPGPALTGSNDAYFRAMRQSTIATPCAATGQLTDLLRPDFAMRDG